MPISIKDGGAWKNANPYVRDAGAWKTVREIWVRDAGVWKLAFQSILTVSVDTTFLSGTTYSNAGAGGFDSAITAEACTVTPTGGLAPYTFAWERVTGSTSVTPSGGTAGASNSFAYSGRVPSVANATWRCKVTSSDGQIVYSPNIDIQLDIRDGSIEA